MTGRVVGLHVNPNGGVPKWPVESLLITVDGCEGDRQRDRRHHGGPKKAVCLMEHAVLASLQEAGHPIGPGSTGENVLMEGFDPGVLGEGVHLTIGDVLLCITGDAPPCKTIRASFLEGDFSSLSHRQRSGMTRWYAEVLREGTVHLGDRIEVNASVPTGSQ